MRNADPAIYPGTYVTCVYDHSKALCQRTATGPDLAMCQPLHCRNVAFSADNTAAWNAEFARLDRRLAAKPPLPPLLAHRMQNRREQIQRLLAEADAAR
ncbi:hypothetical protein AAH979_38000 [Plantactinospora sp. ZYX-F-223]|uniref:hypothetical protein n=1 Tax=Plantactinospora sp. ZYX-F-223 TaxID=3144103 RepID=UPI0031FCB4B9